MATVLGEGPEKARMMLIGEAPGETEERDGRPFVGAAGMLLERLLADVGIVRAECWVDNVMQVRPPKNKFDVFYQDKGRKEPTPELVAGWERLRNTIREVGPDVIVCLGAEALRAVTGLSGIEVHR